MHSSLVGGAVGKQGARWSWSSGRLPWRSARTLVRLLLVWAAVAGSSGCAEFRTGACCSPKARVVTRGTSDASCLLGTWDVEDSTARFVISRLNGAVYMEGWDSGGGEHFQLSGLAWDGTRLTGVFVMPSNGYTTCSSLGLESGDELRGTYAGDTSGSPEVWIRVPGSQAQTR